MRSNFKKFKNKQEDVERLKKNFEALGNLNKL